MMPAAIENRNEVFITDQGSSRDSRRRALRVRRAAPGLGRGAGAGGGGGTRISSRTAGMTAVEGPTGVSGAAAGAVAETTTGTVASGSPGVVRAWGEPAAYAAAATARSSGDFPWPSTAWPGAASVLKPVEE